MERQSKPLLNEWIGILDKSGPESNCLKLARILSPSQVALFCSVGAMEKKPAADRKSLSRIFAARKERKVSRGMEKRPATPEAPGGGRPAEMRSRFQATAATEAGAAVSGGASSTRISGHGKLAHANVEATVLEGRGLRNEGRACLVRIMVEGFSEDTDAMAGADPRWAVPTEPGENPHPFNNHLVFPVVDVVQANLHVMVLTADTEELVGCGMVPVSRLMRYGRSMHEVQHWLALQHPSHVYFPSAEDLVAMGHHTRPPAKKKKNNAVVVLDDAGAPVSGHEHSHGKDELPPLPEIMGYLNLRLHLHFRNKGVWSNILKTPPVPDELPDEVQQVINSMEPEEPVFELVARGKLLFAFLFSFSHSWRYLMLAAIPFWYHLVFWAPLWEYPLLIFVLPTLALTVRNIIQTSGHQTAIEMHDAGLVSAKSRVKASELGVLSEPMRQFFRFVSALLGGSLVPTGEKIQNSFAFVVDELSLIFVASAVIIGLLTSLLVVLFDDPTVVFSLGLFFFVPRTLHVITTSIWGDEVNVYEVSIIRGRNLQAFDSGGTSDPYMRIPQLECIKSGAKVKTPICKKTLNPQWEASFRLALDDAFHHGMAGLDVELWDSDVAAKDDYMGAIMIRRRDFRFESTRWFPVLDVHGQQQGEIEVGLRYLGATYEKFKTSANPYWRQWPWMKRIAGWLPTIGFGNVLAKLPDYVEGARIRYSDVYFFQDVANVVPRASKQNRKQGGTPAMARKKS